MNAPRRRRSPWAAAPWCLCALLALAGCADRRGAVSLLIPPADLTALLSGSSVLVHRSDGWPYQTLLYLDPAGTGWYDALLVAGSPPQTSDMAMILSWQVTAPSRVCVWSTPLIGEMSSNTPPRQDCLTIERSSNDPRTVLEATVTRQEHDVTTTIELRPGNAFPAARREHYAEQVRVLFGGTIPNWTVP